LKRIWIIAADARVRALVAAEVRRSGAEPAGFETPADAIESVLESRPDAVVIDPRGQPEGWLVRLRELGVPVLDSEAVLKGAEPYLRN
jgi:DNA-binding NtrC family response regulator